MARLIDASDNIVAVRVGPSFKAAFFIECAHGWKQTTYYPKDISRFELIDEEQFRSAGKAVAGAAIGGVLTGGVGLLAGAAFGGRRRKTATVFVEFNDGAFVAFEETKGANAKLLLQEIERRDVASRVSARTDDQ